jgi:two-component sensor histidine kinase
VWLGFGLLLVTQFVLQVAGNLRGQMPENPLHDVLQVAFYDGLTWTAVFFCAVALAWLLPLDGGRWKRNVPLLVLGGTAVLYTRLALLATFGATLPGPVPYAALMLYPTQIVAFLTDAGVGYAFLYFFRQRDGELSAMRLEAALARAQLQLLETQMDPHFLFNTLNSVAALMHRDAAGAVELLHGLRRLLARTAGSAGQQTVPLAEELEVVRLYLAIEQRRLGARLRVSWREEPDAEQAAIPRLVLQTLAENAVRHGIARVRAGGTVEVGARREGSRLSAWVRDDGAGLGAQAARGRGIGLSNTRARLAHLYGADHRFDVREREGGGVEARVVVPFAAGSRG